MLKQRQQSLQSLLYRFTDLLLGTQPFKTMKLVYFI